MRLLACAALLCASVAHAAFPLEVTHRQGSVTLNEVPQRVAVFDLGVLDTLDALGVAVAGVPQMAGPGYLKARYEGRETVAVGTLFEPDYAALEAFKPDLIIIGRRSSGAYEKLSAIAPTLDLYISPEQFLQGSYDNLQLLGAVFARQEQARQLESELKGALADLHAKTQGLSGLTLFTVAEHLAVQAPGERHGMLYEVFGLRPVVEAVTPPAEEPARPAPDSPEAKLLRERNKAVLDAGLKQQPDWLIVLDRGAATGGQGKGAEVLGAHTGVAAGTAWQQGKVFYLEPASWYIATGGYQALVAAVQAFGDGL